MPPLPCCTIDAHMCTTARFTSTAPGMGDTRHFAWQPLPSDGRNSDQHVSTFIMPVPVQRCGGIRGPSGRDYIHQGVALSLRLRASASNGNRHAVAQLLFHAHQGATFLPLCSKSSIFPCQLSCHQVSQNGAHSEDNPVPLTFVDQHAPSSIPSLMPRQLAGTLWAFGTAATPLLREPAADAEGTGGKAAAATLQAQSLCKPEGPATHGQGPPASHPPVSAQPPYMSLAEPSFTRHGCDKGGLSASPPIRTAVVL